jgi:hypothetical protein
VPEHLRVDRRRADDNDNGNDNACADIECWRL